MSTLEEIKAEAQRIETQALASTGAYETSAKPWEYLNLWIGIPTTLGAAAASISVIENHPVTSIILEILVAIGTAVITFVDPKEKYIERMEASTSFRNLSNDARVFGNIDCALDQPLNLLAVRIRELNQRLSHLNDTSPALRHSGD